MIRNTISRIKRVWAVTCSPCLLRGDLRCAPGKFQMLTPSTQHSSLLTRSKSMDTISKDQQRKTKHGIESGSEKDVFEDYLTPEMRAHETMHGAPPLYRKTSACRCDECNKIISEIFGTETTSEQDRKKKLLTNITQVNMTDNMNSNEMITDKTVIGSYHKKSKNEYEFRPNTTNENIDSESTTISKDNYTGETVKKKSDQLTVEAYKMYTNLYDVVPEGYEYEKRGTHKGPFSKNQNMDGYWKDVYENAVGENSVYCEPTSNTNKDALNMYKGIAPTNIDDLRRFKHSPTELEKILEQSVKEKTEADTMKENEHIVKTSSHKQDDEKLMQKVEHIDEVPLVEAEKPKVEGFQVTPRVIGNTEKTKVLHNLDEVAKRCLTSPNSQIDEILLKEMEKLGIPLAVQKNNSELKVADDKANTLNKFEKASNVEQEQAKDSHGLINTAQGSRSSDISSKESEEEYKELGLKPSELEGDFSDFNKMDYSDFHNMKLSNDIKSKQNANLESVTRDNVSDADSEYKSKWSYWRRNSSQPQAPACSGMSELEHNTNVAQRMWQKSHLDPELKCNEPSAAASSKTLIYDDKKNMENKDMFAKQNIHSDKCVDPLLEDVESDSIATKAVPSTGSQLRDINKMDHVNPSYTNFVTNNKVEQQPNYSGNANIITPALSRKEGVIDSKEGYEPNTYNTEDYYNRCPNEQLQFTSDRLEAASQHLQATCENLQATSEQLHATSEQLQVTSNNLIDTSYKLQDASYNLNNSSENLQFSSENLRDTTEVPDMPTLNPNNVQHASMSSNEASIANTKKSMNTDNTPKPQSDSSAAVTIMSKADSDTSNMKSSEPDNTSTQEIKSTEKEKKDDVKGDDDEEKIKECGKTSDDNKPSEKNSNIEAWAQQAATVNPAVPMAGELSESKPIPEVTDHLKLSDLLKLVRQRNREAESSKTVLMKTRKNIPPLAQPMANPPSFKMPTYPELRPIPRICGPKKKPPKTNCISCDLKTLGFDQHCSLIGHNEDCPVAMNLDNLETIDLTLPEDDPTKDLTEELILQFHFWSNILESSYKTGKAKLLETAVLTKTRHLAKVFRSQDYEPWSPIPSWPYPKRYKRPKLQCPKDGCKVPPPRTIEDRPCGLKPCESFPTFPSRKFSLLHYYPASVSMQKMVDVGKF